jgi:CspA family cold shock protein
MQGRVTRWCRTYGFVRADDDDNRDLFVHYSAIKRQGFRSLNEGERVTFDIARDARGRALAVNVVPQLNGEIWR